MNLLENRDILDYIPHRFPFLLVDRVLMHDKAAKTLTALKNVTCNEPFFQGHVPDNPVMPGVLIIEALAQTAGILFLISINEKAGPNNWFYLAGVDNARFKHLVLPGDQLILKAELLKARRDLWKFVCTATANNEQACSTEIILIRGNKP